MPSDWRTTMSDGFKKSGILFIGNCQACEKLKSWMSPSDWEEVQTFDISTKDGYDKALIYGIMRIPALVTDDRRIVTGPKNILDELKR